nr:MAG TPA: hypothetical protein [Caudoviricetes sp.]
MKSYYSFFEILLMILAFPFVVLGYLLKMISK